ncbi:MAG: toll/interleukin-1 receptor domain-containing protein [Planctomycetota bacterium]
MPLPKIFVCHSAKSDEDKAYLEAVAEGLREGPEGARFDVLYDTNLRCGDDWNATIHGWLELCHGAVVLLSPRLLRSHYARYELSNLHRRWRSERAQGFRLLIVALPEDGVVAQVRIDELKKRPLIRAVGIDQAQWATGTVAGALDALRDGLRETTQAVAVPRTPTQKLERLLASRIEKWVGGGADLLAAAAEDAGLSTQAWVDPVRYPSYFVGELLAQEIPQQHALVSNASSAIEDDLGATSNTCDLFHRVAGSWIHPELVHAYEGTLPRPGRATAKAAVLNGGCHPFTPTMCLLRARPEHADQLRGHVVEGVFSPRGGDELADVVRAGLIERLDQLSTALKIRLQAGAADEDALEQILDKASRRGSPIVVTLKLEALDLEELEELQAAFEHRLAFFVFCEGDPPSSTHWEVLEPALPVDREANARELYNDLGEQFGLDPL